MQLSFIVTVLTIATVQEQGEKDEFLQVSAKKQSSKLVKSSVALEEPVAPIELGAESRSKKQVRTKTGLASVHTKSVHPHEDRHLDEHHEHKHTHEHVHKHGHHGHHAHHLHAKQKDGELSDTKIAAEPEPEAHEAHEADAEAEEESSTTTASGSCYGNDSRCSASDEIQCGLLEDEGADCRWIGSSSSGGADDDKSMAVAIHSLLAAFAGSMI